VGRIIEMTVRYAAALRQMINDRERQHHGGMKRHSTQMPTWREVVYVCSVMGVCLAPPNMRGRHGGIDGIV